LIQASAEVETEARVDTRVGEVPYGDQQFQVMAVATPKLGFHWFDGPDDLKANVASRILWRPVPLLNTRPLFLETLTVAYTASPTSRSQWHLNLRASYGEQDYTSLSQQFSSQPTLPLSTTMFMVDGTSETSWRSSRRTTLTFRLGGSHRRTLDVQSLENQSSGVAFYTMPTQTTVSAGPALRFALSRLSSVEASVPISDYDIQQRGGTSMPNGPINLVAIQPQLSVLEQLNRRHKLHVTAGLTYADVVRGSTATLGNHFTPIGQVGLDSELYRTPPFKLRSSVNAGATWFMDPVLGSGRWRGSTDAVITAQMGRRWSGSLHVNFVTDISSPPVTNILLDGTMVSVDASLRYRWPRILVAELGGRFSERAPRLGSSEFAWHGRELWAFLSLYAATRVSLTGQRATQDAIGM
jgi:hypothetical protein